MQYLTNLYEHKPVECVCDILLTSARLRKWNIKLKGVEFIMKNLPDILDFKY